MGRDMEVGSIGTVVRLKNYFHRIAHIKNSSIRIIVREGVKML